MKEKIKLIIVFVLGIMISVVISVYAATVIGAGEVSFNGGTSNIKYNGTTAANVEDAINGVYSSANTLATNVSTLGTRVTALENTTIPNNVKLITNNTGHGKTASSTSLTYLGTNVTVPSGYNAILIAQRGYYDSAPTGVFISKNSSTTSPNIIASNSPGTFGTYGNYSLRVTAYVDAGTYYLMSTAGTGKSTESLAAICFKLD